MEEVYKIISGDWYEPEDQVPPARTGDVLAIDPGDFFEDGGLEGEILASEAQLADELGLASLTFGENGVSDSGSDFVNLKLVGISEAVAKRGEFAVDQVGFAERMHKIAKGRWVRLDGRWWIYSDSRKVWSPVDPELMGQAVLSFMRSIGHWEGQLYSDVLPDPNHTGSGKPKSERSAFLAKVSAQMNNAGISGIEKALAKLASTEPGNFEFDGGKYGRSRFYTVQNGVLDFEERQLLPFSPDFKATRVMKSSWNPDVGTELWDKLVSFLVPDEKTQRVIRGIMGDSLFTEGNPRKIFVVLLGAGDSGKSTFLEAIVNAAGDFAETSSVSIFLGRGGSGPRPDMVKIHEKRIIATSEADGSTEIYPAHFKGMTGAEPISYRGLYSDRFTEGSPHYVPFMGTNAMPNFVGADDATWRRIVVIPFNQDARRSPYKKSQLMQDPDMLSSILNWLVAGYDDVRAYEGDFFEDLVLSGASQASKEIREQEEPAAAFAADDAWIVREEGHLELARDITDAYLAYRKVNSLTVERSREDNRNARGRELTAAGIKPAALKLNGARARIGWRLVRSPDELREMYLSD